MANHKSAIKRAAEDNVKRARNMAHKTRVKTVVKAVRTAIADKSEEQAKQDLRKAVSIIHKSASKGLIHKKKASRKISRLARQVNQILQP